MCAVHRCPAHELCAFTPGLQLCAAQPTVCVCRAAGLSEEKIDEAKARLMKERDDEARAWGARQCSPRQPGGKRAGGVGDGEGKRGTRAPPRKA